MIVITGDTRAKVLVGRLRELGWGRMWVERAIEPYAGEPWGFDNGAFGAWHNKKPWDADAYLRRLEQAYAVGRPYLAVVPDMVADPTSYEYSLGWLDRLPADWPWYLAVQDGMVPGSIDLSPFAGVFLGGSNGYKATAAEWRETTHAAGKPFHYGRAGTLRKLHHARQAGADSLDSAFPLWQLARLDEFIRDWRDGPDQLWLPEVA